MEMLYLIIFILIFCLAFLLGYITTFFKHPKAHKKELEFMNAMKEIMMYDGTRKDIQNERNRKL